MIEKALEKLPEEKLREIYERVEKTVKKYGLLESGATFDRTFACPLFEKGTGCLVHETGKPLPCINHACYERQEDLPPDELLTEQEIRVNDLNKRVYGGNPSWLPLPVALLINSSQFAAPDRYRNEQDQED